MSAPESEAISLWLLPYVNTGLLFVISVGGGFAYRLLTKLEEAIEKLDRRLIVLEQFREAHERWCGERNERNERDHGELRESIEVSRKALHDARNEMFRVKLGRRVPNEGED